MCLKLQMPGGSLGIRGGGHAKLKFCACGRAADLLCDWKVQKGDKKSGTCDLPICAKHAQQVGPDKHLCPLHQKAYADWQRRHPGAILPPDYQQLSLL
jgi:hypothetical protein